MVVEFCPQRCLLYNQSLLHIGITAYFHRLMVLAGQPSLSDQLRGLAWEWLIYSPWTSSTMEDGLLDEDTLNHGWQYELEFREMTLKTSVFDTYGKHDAGEDRVIWVALDISNVH